MFASFHDAIGYLFESYHLAQPHRRGQYDKDTRTPHLTRQLLDAVGSPDKRLRTIKVTGSKGKGSTARLIAALLESQGLKVGLFTSPHLIDFTERIRMNGKAIAEDEWIKWQETLYPLMEDMRNRMAPGEYFGPVGIVACVAALYFAAQKTDVNVFELGRGARFDDVNQLLGEIAAITPVQLEHRDLLGPELTDIAWNKAGVIDQGLKAVIAADQAKEALAVIAAEAHDQGVRLLALGRDFHLERVRAESDKTVFDLITRRARYAGVRLSLLGRNQAENAGVAIATVENWLGGALPESSLQGAFANLYWPGRTQRLMRRPQVLIDGAINRDNAMHLREVIEQIDAVPKVLVVGVPVDKDGSGVIAVLAPVVDAVWVTKAQNPHLTFDLLRLEEEASRSVPTGCSERLEDALTAAKRAAGANGLVVVAGTQSLVAEALEYYRVPTRDLSVSW